jgi:hypothetical protein
MLPSGSREGRAAMHGMVEDENGKFKKPRRTLAQRLADAELETNRLRDLYKKEARRADTRKKIVIAGAMLAEARDSREFEQHIKAVVRRRVTRPEDVAAVAEWLSTT